MSGSILSVSGLSLHVAGLRRTSDISDETETFHNRSGHRRKPFQASSFDLLRFVEMCASPL